MTKKIIITIAIVLAAVACQPIPFDQSNETNPEPISGCEADTGEWDTGWDTGHNPCED